MHMSDQFIEHEGSLTDNRSPVHPTSFPLPDRANTFPNGESQIEQDRARLAGLRSFATLQAEQANTMVRDLDHME